MDGNLVIVSEDHADAKPVVYEEIPEFDQEKYYIVQQSPVDVGSHIFMGIEIHDLPPSDDGLITLTE